LSRFSEALNVVKRTCMKNRMNGHYSPRVSVSCTKPANCIMPVTHFSAGCIICRFVKRFVPPYCVPSRCLRCSCCIWSHDHCDQQQACVNPACPVHAAHKTLLLNPLYLTQNATGTDKMNTERDAWCLTMTSPGTTTPVTNPGVKRRAPSLLLPMSSPFEADRCRSRQDV
jgi:hypothetical protein